jgi:hypothetical protein
MKKAFFFAIVIVAALTATITLVASEIDHEAFNMLEDDGFYIKTRTGYQKVVGKEGLLINSVKMLSGDLVFYTVDKKIALEISAEASGESSFKR